jgi:branched-chain amino acid transport system ATP-binding protein
MLSVDDIHTYYGDSHVLQGISLAVAPAQCVALLGRNGVGKTTTLRSIVGLTRARRGRVAFNERDITRQPTYRIVRSGIAYVPEDRGIFPSVTVDEHLSMAFSASRGRPTRKPAEYVYSLFPRLAERRSNLGGQLSGGEQQMLAIGRALVAGPDLMILDEPSEGLAPVIIERLEEVLNGVKASGIPILLVEQNYHLATRLADRVYVLSQGRVQFEGSTAELIDNEAVRRTYLSV